MRWLLKPTVQALVISLSLTCDAALAHAAPLKVVASFTVLGDLTRQVGGEDVSITTLVGANGDTHVYQPTPNDAKALKDADVIIVNGLGFEGWMNRLVESSGTKATVVIASHGIARSLNMEADGEEHHEEGRTHAANADGIITDPHAWQSLTNGRVYVKNIAAGLAAADPAHAKGYADRVAKLDKELSALDAWVKQEIATVPAEKRSVITTHDAFGYFADAYNVTFLAPAGLSTEDEPSAKELKVLVEQVKSGKTRALFFENMSNTNIVKQLASEAGAVVGPPLYADALSAQDGVAATYQEMFKYNVTELVRAMKHNQ
jgi:zinc/manganese transport system substrate-binding protein